MTFSEITEGAIREAFDNPRDIDMHLVDAQQTRRIVDRMVGYTLSPLLSRKVRGGLSAGRVQSVAVRLVVDREREIEAFKAREYWSIGAVLQAAQGEAFPAELLRIDGKALEIGDEETATGHAEAIRASRPVITSMATRDHAAQPQAALHHQHPAAGCQPQARLQPQAHHARRAAPVRGHGHRRGPGRPHHLHAHRLHGHGGHRDGRSRSCRPGSASARPM